MTHTHVLATVTIAALVATGPAAAQNWEQCRAAAGGVEPKLKACDIAEVSARDVALNAVYQQLLGAVAAARKPRLRDAERAWVSYRDAECAFRTSAETGGSDDPQVGSACRIELTGRRVVELRQALKIARF